MRFIENGDPADRQQNDALRRNTGAPRHQCVTQLMEHYAPENDANQSKHPQYSVGMLTSTLGAQYEGQQKQESQMNADFDSEKTPQRDGPTAHRHTYKYSI